MSSVSWSAGPAGLVPPLDIKQMRRDANIWSQLPGEKVRMCFPFDPLGVGAVLESRISSPHPLRPARMSDCWRRLKLESVAVSLSAATTAHFTRSSAAGLIMHSQTSLFQNGIDRR